MTTSWSKTSPIVALTSRARRASAPTRSPFMRRRVRSSARLASQAGSERGQCRDCAAMSREIEPHRDRRRAAAIGLGIVALAAADLPETEMPVKPLGRQIAFLDFEKDMRDAVLRQPGEMRRE